MRTVLVSLALTLGLSLGTSMACGGKGGEKPAPAAAPAAATSPGADNKPASAPAGNPSPANGADNKPAAAPAATASEALMDPSKANETAPATFKVKLHTTKGDFVVEVQRDWSPNGADRFFNLVKSGFFKDIAFFRAIDGFMVQFGISGDPKIAAAWRGAQIQDDAVKASNTRGMVTFAKTGAPNSRTTQIFINFGNNANLDSMGFSPFGKVVEGMEIVDSLYKGYGEGAPRGRGPDQQRVQAEGNTYLKASFPELDYINSAEIM